MSVVIYYFSGTGNSLFLARRIAESTNGDVLSIAAQSHAKEIAVQADTVGIVFRFTMVMRRVSFKTLPPGCGMSAKSICSLSATTAAGRGSRLQRSAKHFLEMAALSPLHLAFTCLRTLFANPGSRTKRSMTGRERSVSASPIGSSNRNPGGCHPSWFKTLQCGLYIHYSNLCTEVH